MAEGSLREECHAEPEPIVKCAGNLRHLQTVVCLLFHICSLVLMTRLLPFDVSLRSNQGSQPLNF